MVNILFLCQVSILMMKYFRGIKGFLPRRAGENKEFENGYNSRVK